MPSDKPDRYQRPNSVTFNDRLAALVTMAAAGKANTAGEGEMIAEIVERLVNAAAMTIAWSNAAGDDAQVAYFSEGAIHYFETALADHLKTARALGLHKRQTGGPS